MEDFKDDYKWYIGFLAIFVTLAVVNLLVAADWVERNNIKKYECNDFCLERNMSFAEYKDETNLCFCKFTYYKQVTKAKNCGHLGYNEGVC